MVKCVSVVLLVCLLAAAPVGCGTGVSDFNGSGVYQEPQTEYPEPAPEDDGSSVVSWKDAADHEGEVVTIKALGVSTFYADTSNGEPTFLNVGKDYPDAGRFTVVIWGEDRDAFSEATEDMCAGVTIRVTGLVDSYEGVPQIEVSSPSDIEIVP